MSVYQDQTSTPRGATMTARNFGMEVGSHIDGFQCGLTEDIEDERLHMGYGRQADEINTFYTY